MWRDPRFYIAVLVLGTYAGTLGLGILGADSWALIETARVASWRDLVGTLTEPFMEGRFQVSYYRPVLNLSLALDWALGGMHPLVYQLDQLALFLATALTLLALARRLTGPGHDLAAFVTTAAFVLYPPVWETIPVASRRHDLACILLVTATVLAHLDREGAARERVRWRTGLLALLAAGFKETGYLALPLAAWTVLLYSRRAGLRARLSQALRTTLPEGIALALLTGARLVVLRGASVSEGTQLPSLEALLAIARSSLVGDRDTIFVPAANWVIVAVALGLGALAAVHLQSGRDGADRPAGSARALRGLALALGWYGLVCALVSTQGTPWIMVWHLPLPMAGMSLGAAALLAGMREAWPAWSVPARVLAALGIAPLLGLQGLHVARSHLLQPDRQWEQSDALLRPYLAQVAALLDAAPDGTNVTMPPAPVGENVISGRSQAAWARLRFPERELLVVGPLGGDSRIPDGLVLTIPLTSVMDWGGLEGRVRRAILQMAADTREARMAVRRFTRMYTQGEAAGARAALVEAAAASSRPAQNLQLLERYFESIAADRSAARAREIRSAL